MYTKKILTLAAALTYIVPVYSSDTQSTDTTGNPIIFKTLSTTLLAMGRRADDNTSGRDNKGPSGTSSSGGGVGTQGSGRSGATSGKGIPESGKSGFGAPTDGDTSSTEGSGSGNRGTSGTDGSSTGR